MRKSGIVWAAGLVVSGSVIAQPAEKSVSQTAAASASAAAEAPAAPSSTTPICPAAIPALTPVELVLDVELGSKISQTGQVFPLHLAEPIVIDGCEVAPAGATGEGEVIHAKRAGASGSSGELVLAARYVMVNGSRLQLRSMKVGVTGKDNVQTATAMAPVIGIFSFAITGKNAEYPQGTHAIAKTRADFPISGAMAAQQSAAPDASPAATSQAQMPATSTVQAP